MKWYFRPRAKGSEFKYGLHFHGVDIVWVAYGYLLIRDETPGPNAWHQHLMLIPRRTWQRLMPPELPYRFAVWRHE